MAQSKKRLVVGDMGVRCRRDFMDVKPSMQNGQIVNREGFVELISHIADEMNSSLQDYCLLLSESPVQSREQREWLCQAVFEQLNVRNFFLVKSGVLSAFSSGRQNALILDTGAQQTYSMPIYDGYCIQKSVIKQDIGGEYITQKLLNYIEQQMKIQIHPRFELDFGSSYAKKDIKIVNFPNTTPSFYDFWKMEIVREIKETVCKVNDKSSNITEVQDKLQYELPDGQIVNLD